MFAAIEQPSGAGEVISIVVTTLMILALGIIEVVPVMQRFRSCWRRRAQLKAKDVHKKEAKNNANNTVNSNDSNGADVWAPTKTRRVISSNMTELMEMSEKSGGTCKRGMGGGGGAGEDQVVMEVEMPPMLRARLAKAATTSSSSSSSSSSSTRQRCEKSGKESTESGMTLDTAKRQASVNVDEGGDNCGNDDNASSHDDGHVGGVKEDGDDDAGGNSGLRDSYGSSAHGVENGSRDDGDGGGDAGDDGCDGPGMETAEGGWQEEEQVEITYDNVEVDDSLRGGEEDGGEEDVYDEGGGYDDAGVDVRCNSLFSPEGFAQHQARQSGSHAVKFIGGSRVVKQDSAD